MRKREFLRLVLICAIPTIVVFALQIMCVVDFSVINTYHFNIITVNSIFAGFLFTALSLVLGLGKNQITILLERMSALAAICKIILTGILSCFISIGCALINIFTRNQFSNIINVVQVSALLVTMFLFIWAVYYVNMIINAIRSDIRKQTPSQEIVDSTTEKMKS